MMPPGHWNFNHTTRMKKLPFYTPTLIVALLLGREIWTVFGNQESALCAAQKQWLADQKMSWAQADASHAVLRREQAVEREKAHEQVMLQALGGALAAVAKNPELNIEPMLRQTAIACAPAGTTVLVTVDRFTEFDVVLVLPEVLGSDRLAEISRSLLENGNPYVHTVRFFEDNRLLAYLNHAAIESVTNWSSASAEAIKAALVQGDAMEQPVANVDRDAAGGNPRDETDLNPVQIKIQTAEHNFSDDSKQHVNRLNEIVTRMDKAVRMEGIQTHLQFQLQMTGLDNLQSQLSDERKFFLDQASDFEHRLDEQQLDPLLISILKRGVAERNAPRLHDYKNLFDSLSNYLQQIRTFLNQMEDAQGQWSVDTQTGLIQFSSEEVRDTYSKGSDLLRFIAGRVQDAFQTLANDRSSK